ncbi:hypothetical protein AG1IA_01018 [Rhizoctonia solani AG-1 IA]|uniref:Uncharacterized protein n=1 Tax=Thanatephorus cucumeris (strain AG1-IA) TaxID=983506 RepID=L8X3S0_THACA|nr:hypothetical protein AG1IA_01018 [Rhizoctonia solani AG-1 IA]
MRLSIHEHPLSAYRRHPPVSFRTIRSENSLSSNLGIIHHNGRVRITQSWSSIRRKMPLAGARHRGKCVMGGVKYLALIVTSVQSSGYVLSLRREGFSGNNLGANGGLDRNLEQLLGYDLLCTHSLVNYDQQIY